ncbi:MAG: response regulator transcription factor [Bacteroidetes bacterium]|nr:response regulator transcription factor [Bacteroidota bacterium]
MTLTCLAVDDEPLALDIIESYAGKVDWLRLSGRCTSSTDAISFLQGQDVDLLLLDIQLPDLNGFELLSTLRHPPLVIFTTAYESYAVESYTVDAVDYLVKPFSFERFLRAAQKAAAQKTASPIPPLAQQIKDDSVRPLFIHTDTGDVRVEVDDLLYVKGMNEYAVVRSGTQEYVVRESLRQLEARLAPFGFIRVHKSWIVSLRKITVVDRGILRVGDAVIPVGKSYRDALRQLIEQSRIG